MDIKTALSDLTNWFEEYVKGFGSEDPGARENIELKKNHTFWILVKALISMKRTCA